MDTIDPITRLSGTPSPNGGEGKTCWDPYPGRRAEFPLRTLPWANVCCPFSALAGNSGILPLLI